MQYQYEVLTPDRFQELCQALVAKVHPDARCYPVGQADGGRDATATIKEDGETRSLVYQVKFRRTLKAGDDQFAIVKSAIDDERAKVERLQGRGADKYILVTNLSGSSRLDVGVRDRVEEYLKKTLLIDGQVWWREDIDARLNDAYDIKWAFSEILTSADFLRKLIEAGIGENAERRNLAITAYLTAQYEIDEFVKFKQADLQASDLLSLFIDVPATLQRSARERDLREDFVAIKRVLEATHDRGGDTRRSRARFEQVAVGAATLLLHPIGQAHYGRVVLEGGPGQGKSTLAQYVCQVHRMHILGKTDRLKDLPADHRHSPTRVPFKVDLRDLSAWLRHLDPFHGLAGIAATVTVTLETFLAAQVEHASGGQSFTVDDLRLYLAGVPALVVLDGLDEVAQMADRRDVIDATNSAMQRISATAKSVQFLVTSRPAATAAAPRLTDNRWQYLELSPITEELIYEYTERWSRARRIPVLDVDEIKRILRSKLPSEHIKELSRNAMQLTILLQLIHSRGHALPDQRTELYDRYIDVLFNREADKNPIVLDNRQLLIDLHGYLAWKIHSGAQSRRSNGRVSEKDLRELIDSYMLEKGHRPESIDDLFVGVVQRIVALVSRVEGTFEFEVQPLREYFAARHLYNTAPYSPSGSPRSGTKPEIFAAISPQPYWLNVTRFFAGCYSMGELSGLAEQLKAMLTEGPTALTSFPRVVATSLLADRVFQQDPKVTRALAEAAADPLTARFGMGRFLGYGEGPTLGVPPDCGEAQFVSMLTERAMTHELPAIRSEAALVLREWFTPELQAAAWESVRPDLLDSGESTGRWLQMGLVLGTLRCFDNGDFETLVAVDERYWRVLAVGGCSVAVQGQDQQFRLLTGALDGAYRAGSAPGEVGFLAMLLNVDMWFYREARAFRRESLPIEGPKLAVAGLSVLMERLVSLLDLSDRAVDQLIRAASAIEEAAGRCWAAYAFGIAGAQTVPSLEGAEVGASLSKGSVMSGIAAAMQHRADSAWWGMELAQARDMVARRAVLATLFLWGTPASLSRNLGQVDEALESLSTSEFTAVFEVIQRRLPPNMNARKMLGRKALELSEKCTSSRSRALIASRGAQDAGEVILMGLSPASIVRDPIIAATVLDAALSAWSRERDEGRRNWILGAVRTAFAARHATVLVGHGFYRSGVDAIDANTARDLLSRVDEYPVGLVQAADAALSGSPAGAAAVARIARRDKWAAG